MGRESGAPVKLEFPRPLESPHPLPLGERPLLSLVLDPRPLPLLVKFASGDS